MKIIEELANLTCIKCGWTRNADRFNAIQICDICRETEQKEEGEKPCQ